MKKKAVFLDFFGTIVHEVYDLLDCIVGEFYEHGARQSKEEIVRVWWNGIAKRSDSAYGDTFRKQKTFYGETLNDMIEFTGVSVDVNALVERLIQFTVSAKPFEDSVAFLDSCSIPCFILSNIDDYELSVMVKKNSLNVQGTFTSEEARAYKPNSVIFKKGLEKFGYSARDVLYVGDSLRNDYFGAKNAGIDSVWINRLNKDVPSDVLTLPNVLSVLDLLDE